MPEETIPLSRVQIDDTIYPRKTISSTNISAITEAILAGVELPKMLVAAKSYKLVDGKHRYESYAALWGPQYKVTVDVRPYPGRREMFADAVRMNVGHGEKLSRWDLLHAAGVAEQLGINEDAFAKLAGWRPSEFKEYRKKRTGKTMSQKKIALKRSLRHLIDGPGLTPAQVEVNDHTDGMADMYHANQLIMRFEANTIRHSEELSEKMLLLAELIMDWDSRFNHTTKGA